MSLRCKTTGGASSIVSQHHSKKIMCTQRFSKNEGESWKKITRGKKERTERGKKLQRWGGAAQRYSVRRKCHLWEGGKGRPFRGGQLHCHECEQGPDRGVSENRGGGGARGKE